MKYWGAFVTVYRVPFTKCEMYRMAKIFRKWLDILLIQ